MGNVVAAVMAIFFAMAPVKSYVKPGEPVLVRFVQSDSDKAPKDAEILGLKSVEVPDLFKPVTGDDLVTKGAPQFQLYSLTAGAVKAVAPHPVDDKVELKDGTVDIAAFFPIVREPGTYILTWKTATPLVINTLLNPGPAKRALSKMTPDEIAHMDPREKEQMLPVATHIVPLQYALISTDKGDIKATFAYDVAPETIVNFIALSDDKFYDGTVFHRIIKDFMIQGGDSVGNSETRAGTGGPGHSVVQEFSEKPHLRGVLSMARSQDPDSGGSQFFIMLAEKSHLNGGYTAFGQVIGGMTVVDKIAETPVIDENGSTKPSDRPVIKSIRILPATPDMYGIKS